MENLKIVIAGAGAGKTHNLKEEVLKCLPDLDNVRFCAVITFTNAATEELRKRLSQEVKIQHNLFIGTIHGFLVKFVIEPYGKILNFIPDDKIFVDSVTAQWADKKTRIEKANEYEQKGIIVYDKILEISEKILLNDNIFNLFTNRLQYLFIDEYQDNRIKTHRIWEKLIQHKTKVYLIGDPLQHIYKFTYDTTHLDLEEEPSSFLQTPLKELKESYPDSVESLKYNRRSSKNIIDFINNFILEEKHKQNLHDDNKDNQIPVYFIAATSPATILKKYHHLKDSHKISDLHNSNILEKRKDFFESLYLTKGWIDTTYAKDNFKEIYKEIYSYSFHLVKGENIQTSNLQEISRNILGIANIKKSEFIKDVYDEILYRKICFYFFEKSKEKTYREQKLIVKNIFDKCFYLNINISDESGTINQERSLTSLFKEQKKNQSSFFSTVYSCKGLEATSVLVITENNQELNDWLDFKKSNSELDDKYRLGYVAFSRARDMLCISCLGNVDSSLIEKLENLNVHII